MPRATTHKQHGRKSPLPDRSRADIEKNLAKCGEAMSSLTIARQNVLSRYTPSGAPKP
jgi:hypothetical protein